MFQEENHIHFIGIGGSGISSLAHLVLAEGITVSGSNQGKNVNTEQLENEGATIFDGHHTKNLPQNTSMVIYTEAIDQQSNPEFLAAKEKGIQCLSYFQALGKLSQHKKTIVVTGTHGKTTTTAMLGKILVDAGLDPLVIVGSRVPDFNDRNIHLGKGEWLVAEACEYRESFLNFDPFGMLVLNCEWEHVDYYKTEAHYIEAYQKLAQKISQNGFFIFNQEDQNSAHLAQNVEAKKIGIDSKLTEKIELQIPGQFNRLNAAHTLKAAQEIGIAEEVALASLKSFRGTARRMEIKGEVNGVLIVDDYAHHPTEIKATLGALKEKYPEKRLICVFQPHQYSRTLEFLEGFKTAFNKADKVIIPNIYEARDTNEDKAKIDGKKLCQNIPNAIWGDGAENTIELLKKELKKGDLLVTMGAGDVHKIGEKLSSL